MNFVKVGFGLALSYPVYTFLIPAFYETAQSRFYWWLKFSNPSMEEVTGVNFIPNMLFVVACVGLGLIAADIIFALPNIVKILSIYVRACGRAIRILTSKKTQETKS